MQSFQDVKEHLRRSIDLVDLVSEHVSLKRAGRNLKGLCPFHKEKTPSFNVLPERQIFKCFGCQAGGDIFTNDQLIEHVDFAEALRVLADRAGVELKPRRTVAGEAPTIGRADIARANEWAAKWFRAQLLGDTGVEVRAYLTRRRISQDSCERFQIGLAPHDGRLQEAARLAGLSNELLLAADLVRAGDHGGTYETFRERLMFPIRDAGNRCVGFGGRALGDSPAKYLNTARNDLFDKSRCLFGLPLARDAIHQHGQVVVVEGYTDCIACHQHGFANTVATLGTSATEEHMRTLRRYVDSVILLFDSDAAGEAAAERALAVALQQNLTVRIAQVPEGQDPADCLQDTGPEQFGALLNSAVDALGFMWDRTLARFTDPGGGSGRRRAVVEFVNLVGELSRFGTVDAIQRGVVIHQVARLLALPAQEVSGLFARRPARRGPPSASGPAAHADAGPAHTGAGPGQLALVNILEILVCEPDLLGHVSDVLRAERFENTAYRHIAEVFLHLAERPGDFDVSELIAALESPDEARLVTDMVFRGEQRGNLSATLAALKEQVRLLETVQRSRAASEKVRQHATASTGGSSDDEIDAYLADVGEGCSLDHFAGQVHRGAPRHST